MSDIYENIFNGVSKFIYENPLNLPNLFKFSGDNRDKAVMERIQAEATDSFRLQPNQYHSYQNIVERIAGNHPYVEDELKAGFDAYIKNPVRYSGYLQTLAQYGNEERQHDSHYVLWLSVEDDKLYDSCSKLNGKVFDLVREPELPHPNCRCKKLYYGSVPATNKYLKFIISGITTPKNSDYILALGDEITKQLRGKNSQAKIDILYIAAYDDSDGKVNWNEGMPGDITQVYSRAFN